MSDTALADALDGIGQSAANAGGWERLGFLRNPYPTRASPIWDVFHNQADVRNRFYADLRTFLIEPNPATTLFFTGGNRVGKTHFMEHHRSVLPREVNSRGIVLPIAVVSAEFAHLERFFFSVVDQLTESLHLQAGATLIEEPMANPGELEPGDFRRAMEGFVLSEASHREHMRNLLNGWIRGERLRQTQRHELGVYGLLDSASQVQNTFGGLIRYLRSRTFGEGADARKCHGILVFVDEFELVWRQRRDRRDQFLQGLRAIVDVCAKGGLFLCVGMATNLGVELPELHDVEVDYPALYARLKGERDVPALVQIESGLVAIEYARAFEDHGRDVFVVKHPNDRDRLPSKAFFSNKEIDLFFREMVGGSAATVTQADFFDRLHNEAEEKRRLLTTG